MGKGGGGAKIKASPAEVQQAANLKFQLENVQKPIVGATIGPAIGALSGAFDTSLSAPERETIEGQFGQARENIIGQSGARGGMLQKQLVGLDTARAQDVSSAINQAKQRGTERALTLLPSAFPGASSTMAAQGNLARLGNERNVASAQQAAEGQRSLFSGIGGLLGLGLGGGGGGGIYNGGTTGGGTGGTIGGSIFKSLFGK